MEIQFLRKPLPCMRPFYNQTQTQEQTQEIRLPDAYPDIGKVLGCWGKVLIRGKEWRSTSMGANGGVMGWILYAPEDGTQPRVLDVWVPFQWRWDFQDAAEDGAIFLCPVLADLDCRGISARKIMVRAVVSNCGHAMTKQKIELTMNPELPDDVQLLTESYPMELPVEAGEKQVSLEENVTIPDMDPTSRIISYDLSPMILEQKVLGNRLVFRGMAELSVMYMTEDGMIKKWQTEIPFSQYTDLDREYEPTASAWIIPMVTSMELEETVDGNYMLRAGVSAQYLIFDRMVIEVVEDAFSPIRDIQIKTEDLMPPAVLDRFVCDIHGEGKMEGDIAEILSTFQFHEYPALSKSVDGMQISFDGGFRMLYQTREGQMTADTVRCQWVQNIDSHVANQVFLWPGIPSEPEMMTAVDSVNIQSKYPVTVQVYSGQEIPMVTELELGECKEPDENRPSIILRRAGDNGLWAIAKECGSTVNLIKEANNLDDEPVSGQMLLIPVM